MSGGFVPVSAVLLRRRDFLKVFDTGDNCALHFSTFEGNKLAMVASMATLHELDSEHLIENAARMGALLLGCARCSSGMSSSRMCVARGCWWVCGSERRERFGSACPGSLRATPPRVSSGSAW